jgi:murein DD-endopeptidase MepM/ murein hydrolase activator NlpD
VFTTRPQGQRPAASARKQRRLKALAAPVLAAGAMLTMAFSSGAPADAAPGSSEDRVLSAQLREQAGTKARELVTRQQFLDEVTAGAFADDAPTPVAEQSVRIADAATIVGLAAPVPSLGEWEAAQIDRIAALTAEAESRGDVAERTIRRAGLSPRLVAVRADVPAGEGGPLQPLAAGVSADPALNRLAAAVTRMSALEHGLDRIPTHAPANVPFVSSSFGYRSDPFTGETAMHAGLDFPAPSGTPIHAAADGVVTFVGSKGGYGNCVEVTHGNGMMTRYGHMAGFRARVGQKVAAGETIGLIGSTGRSTGPHLHFEVRVNGAAVNPKPFLAARA